MQVHKRTLKWMKRAGRYCGKALLLSVALILASFATAPLVSAQVPGPAPGARPRLVVTIPRVESGSGEDAILAETLADAMDLTLRLTERYDVRPRPTARTAPADIAAVAEYAREQELDFIVFGEILRSAEGGTNTVLRLYSTEAGRVTLTRAVMTEPGASTAALVATKDRLATDFLTVFTGESISWSRIELVNQASPSGEFLVYVDGALAGRNTLTLNRIPRGERLVEVVALDGPRAREVIASRRIQLDARAPGRVSFHHSGTGEALPPEALLSPEASRVAADDPPPPEEEPRPPAPEQDPAPDRDPAPEFSRIGTFLGFRIGYGFAWLGGEGYRDALGSSRWDSPVDDFALGLVLEQGLSERFALGLDFSFGLRGGKAVVRDDEIGNPRYEVNADVVSLSFYLKPRTSGERASMYLLFGPQLVLIENEPEVKVKADLFSDSFDLDPDEEVLFGLVLGVGGDVPVGRRALFFADMLYTRTLTSFYDDGDWFFNALTVGAGIKFRL